MCSIKPVFHRSVLLHESVRLLNINPTGLYVDGTFGLGGHSKFILSQLSQRGRLLGIDRDRLAVEIGQCVAKKDSRFTIVHGSFSEMKKIIKNKGYLNLVNGILLDLGLSTLQLHDVSRGFSFMRDGPLDMRMDVSIGKSAAHWLAKVSQKELYWVLKNFGEERFAKKISRVIVAKRERTPILRSHILSHVISSVIPYRNGYKHPATRSFLAIRMYINRELEELIQVLESALEILSVHGRLVVISFNSLEDRVVKRFINKYSKISVPHKIPLTEIQRFNRYKHKCQLRNIDKIVPSMVEIRENICARSAVLRCAEKTFVAI